MTMTDFMNYNSRKIISLDDVFMSKRLLCVEKEFLKGALNILEFCTFVKIIDILVALATVFERKTAKLLVKITKKEK